MIAFSGLCIAGVRAVSPDFPQLEVFNGLRQWLAGSGFLARHRLGRGSHGGDAHWLIVRERRPGLSSGLHFQTRIPSWQAR